MSAGDTTQGVRLSDGHEIDFKEPDGAYWIDPDGKWRIHAPGSHLGHLGHLGNHHVEEHDDGTITVSPSILITPRAHGQDVTLWHGYLERGIWREV